MQFPTAEQRTEAQAMRDDTELHETGDPSEEADPILATLVGGSLAVLQGAVPMEHYLRLAGDVTLARLGQAWHGRALIEALDQVRAQAETEGGQDLLLFADALERHASALDDLGCGQLALPLYAAVLPVFREHAAPEMLSGKLLNAGVMLQHLGRLPEAVSAYEEAIAIRRRLVDDKGRDELANDLATVLMNRGVALCNLGRLPEALSAYEEAIAIRRPLVDGGRAELAGGLALCLLNLGRLHLDNHDLQKVRNALDAIQNLRRHPQVRAQRIPLFRGNDLRKYHGLWADLLWAEGDRSRALRRHACGLRLVRQTRRTAGIDEESLEFVAEQRGFVDQTVRRFLEAGRPADAFAAMQEGKAGVLGDLHGRLATGDGEPDDVRQARRRLTDCLRGDVDTAWPIPVARRWPRTLA